MSGANVLTRDDDIDVTGIFKSLRRKWWLILLVTLITGACLLVVLSLVSPRYESTARILVRDGASTFTRATNDTSAQQPERQFDEQAIRSEVEILASDKLVLEVIDDLDLTSLEEFEGDKDNNSVRNRVLELAGQEDRIEQPRNVPVETEKRNKTLREIKERLNVYAVERSRVLVIEFWANNAELAQTIVAAISEKYIKQKSTAKLKDSETATVWLDPRIRQLEKDVTKAEADVAQFRANNDLLQTDNNDSLLATEQLSQVSRELSRLKAERSTALSRAQTIKQAINNGSSLDVIPEVIASPLIQRLREREVELRARISDLSTTLLPNHPRLRALASQLDDFQSQIRSAANNVVKGLENNVEATLQAEASLEREIEELKKNSARLDEKLVELRALERKAEAERELLSEYKSRFLEANTRTDLSQVDAEIISPATLADKAFFPKIIPFTIAGMVAALLLTVLGVIAGSLLTAVSAHHEADRRKTEPMIDDAEIIEADSNVNEQETASSVLAGGLEIDESQKFKNRERALEKVQAEQADAAMALAAERLRKPEVTQARETDDVTGLSPHSVRVGAEGLAKLSSAVIVVVSPGGDFGSSTSWLLARKLAKFDRSVVLLDMSGGEISSRKMLGKSGLPGLFNLMSGAVRADQILYKDRASSVNVVPPGSLFPGTPAPDQQMLEEIIEAISSPFDFCVIDCGEANVPEIEMIAGDDAIVVISCMKATRTEVEELEQDVLNAGYSDVLLLAADKCDLEEQRQATELA
ncbi:MAG: Wzz/FepE/Etk N-terminal domain-containing protein [Rhizobiaceae bacterium]|nr:Wzz/FepE/Etk N-terminal domain-containing protein [Rhizobiaceae bacterium]